MNTVATLITDALVVLPYALAVAAFYFFLRTVYHVKAPVRPLFLWPIVLALIGTGAFMIWGHYYIATSNIVEKFGGSFSPFYSVSIALAGYVVAWLLFYFFRFLLEKMRIASRKFK